MSFVAVLRKKGEGCSQQEVNVMFVLMIYTESSTAIFIDQRAVGSNESARTHARTRESKHRAHTGERVTRDTARHSHTDGGTIVSALLPSLSFYLINLSCLTFAIDW